MIQRTLGFTDTRTRFQHWLDFHRDNPHVYELFERFAVEAFSKGKKVGARNIWEKIRWELAIETNSEDWKLNDHFVPYESRLAMLRNPQLAGFFERRDARFDTDDETLLREADAIDRERN